MTIEQAAAFLQLSRETLYKYAQSGRIPATKVGRHWRFKQETLEAFIDQGAGRPATTGSGGAVTSMPAAPPAGDRILSALVVDDDASIRKLIGTWIQLAGHRAAFASSGREAVEILKNTPFDAVFLDLHLGDLSGDEVLDALTTPVQPAVVLITGDPESPIMDRALKHAVTYALSKPFSGEDVAKVLNLVARRAAA